MTSAVQIQPMQWASIPYMGDADLEVFTDEDAACFKDIRDVLMKHNALHRFGMFLIHQHFEIADDEEMMECTDHDGRTLTIVPRKKSAIDRSVTVPTNWVFTTSEEVAIACCTCARNENGHQGYHR